MQKLKTALQLQVSPLNFEMERHNVHFQVFPNKTSFSSFSKVSFLLSESSILANPTDFVHPGQLVAAASRMHQRDWSLLCVVYVLAHEARGCV